MQEFDNLKKRIWTTKNSRFNASRRLKKTSVWSLWTVTFLSLLLIFISIFSIVFSEIMNPFQIKVVGVSSVMMSVYAICLSLFVAMQDYTRKQAILYLSGNALLEIYNRMNAEREPDNGKLLEYTHEYQSILDHYSENHDNSDYLLAIALSDEKVSFGTKLLLSLQNGLRQLLYAIGLLILPFVIVVITLYAFFGWGMFARFVTVSAG